MPPPDLRCPNCRSSHARWLRESSQDALADYYLCNECSHVWSIARGAEHTVRNVTPLADRSEPASR